MYTYPDNFRAQKALIAAKYSGADLTVAKDFVFGETNKSADFLKKFPLGKVALLVGLGHKFGQGPLIYFHRFSISSALDYNFLYFLVLRVIKIKS